MYLYIYMHIYLLGCNNGGGGNFTEVKRLVRKWIGIRKQGFSGFPGFWSYPCGILETQKLFYKAYLTHKPTYAMFMGSWNVKEKWIQTHFKFGPVTVDSVEDFPPFLRF